jgi:hypothetical protein
MTTAGIFFAVKNWQLSQKREKTGKVVDKQVGQRYNFPEVSGS